MAPLLVFRSHFDGSFTVGDVKIPIKIKRLDKGALEQLDAEFTRLCAPRGEQDTTTMAALAKELEVDRYKFFKMALGYVTLDEGVIEDNGASVVDGAGLISIFHSRKEILTEIIGEVILHNHLVPMTRKNSKSPLDTDTGSEDKSRGRGDERSVSIASSAELMATAESLAVARLTANESTGKSADEASSHSL